jgi:heat shock protein HslJ
LVTFAEILGNTTRTPEKAQKKSPEAEAAGDFSWDSYCNRLTSPELAHQAFAFQVINMPRSLRFGPAKPRGKGAVRSAF